MTWLSPAYPVGAFAYSSGIEWAVEAGDIADLNSLLHWLEALLTEGTGFNDGVFFAHAYRAATTDNDRALIEIAELAAAFVPSRERHLETTTLGRAFMDVTSAAWPCAALDKLRSLWSGPFAYPIAVGAACAGHDIPLASALHAFLSAVTANWVSAAVRLVPLGHTDSQRTLRALEPIVTMTTERALIATVEDLGSATFRPDLATMHHETKYTRLFRS